MHVVLSTTDLGASRIPAFDGVEVDWSAGRQEGTSRLSAALVFCPTQEQEAACQESLDAGEARREALHEAWATGEPAEPTALDGGDHLEQGGQNPPLSMSVPEVPAASAPSWRSLSAAEAFGLKDRGLIAPGLRADIVAIDSVEGCHAQLVLTGGRVVDDAAFAARGTVAPVGRGAGKPGPPWL